MKDPDEHELTGVFVARLWPDVHGLRARVRHTVDLTLPEVEATSSGPDEQVVSELIGRFSSWAKDFASAAHPAEDPPGPPGTDPMTPQ